MRHRDPYAGKIGEARRDVSEVPSVGYLGLMEWASLTADLFGGARGPFSVDEEQRRSRKLAVSGSMHLNVEVAFKNLTVVSDVFRQNEANAWLINGTLLGAIRDGALIPFDNDCDLGIMVDNPVAIHNSLEQLIGLGFEIIRVTRRGDLISIMRDGEVIDISLYSLEWAFFRRYLVSSGGAAEPYRMVRELRTLCFQGHSFLVPARSQQLLEFWYGASWMEPIEGRPRKCNVPMLAFHREVKKKTRAMRDYLFSRLTGRRR